MRRAIEIEIGENGSFTWFEGAIGFDPALDLSRFEPGTLLEVEGVYDRPDRHTRVLRHARIVRVAARPLDRLQQAWRAHPRDRDAIARFTPAIERDSSPMGHAFRAGLAVLEERWDDARAAFLAALRGGMAEDGL